MNFCYNDARKAMRLGIVYLVVCDVRDGQYTTAAPFARYVEALLPHVDDIRLMVPVSREKPLERAGYPLSQNPKIEVVELPPIYHLKDFFRSYFRHRSILTDAIAGCDLVNVRLPNFLGLVAGECCVRARKPFFISLVGDYSGVIQGEKYSGVKKILGDIILEYHETRLKRLLGEAYSLANGQGLHEKYEKFAKKMEVITTTTIFKDDFFERDDTCLSEPARILTVAVMQGYKGIPHLLDAASILKQRGRRVVYDLLGTGSRLDDYRAEVTRKGLDDVVSFHGHVQYGGELFDFYRNADMFVLPSTGAEGTPRVVVEAMSQSLPIIATKVGGNPATISEGKCGMLIEPGDPDAIAGAIENIIDDGELRRRLIRNGFERAHDFTMDNHSKDLFEKLSNEFPGMFNSVNAGERVTAR